jgi:hypothetical protein
MAFERHRDLNGQLGRKHGNTLISEFRKHYGSTFATDCADNQKLKDVLDRLDEPSLSQLLNDLDIEKLVQI